MFIGIYLNELKTYVHAKSCTWILIAPVFLITQTWRQPGCPLVDKWINKLWYIQIIEYYSALKVLSYRDTKRRGKNVNVLLLSETNQSEKTIYCMIPTM